MATDTEFGILIKAIDQASSTLRGVQGELDRLQRASKITATSTTELNKAQQQLSATFSSITTAVSQQIPGLSQLSSQMTSVTTATTGAGGVMAGIAVAVVAVGAAMFAAAKSVGEYAIQMKNVALETGLSTTQLAALKVGAAETGTDFSNLQAGLFRFSRQIADANEGNAVAAAKFKDLGIAIKDSATNLALPASVVFENVARRMQEMKDPTERARLAFELFGRSGAQFIPVLLHGMDSLRTKAEELGITLSAQDTAAALQADRAFKELGLSVLGLKNAAGVFSAQFVVPVLDGLKSIVQWIPYMNAEVLALFGVMGNPPKGRFGQLIKSEENPDIVKGPSDAEIAAKALAKTIQEQYDATVKTVALLDQRRAWAAINTEEEVKALEAMQKQVLSKRELVAIQMDIARLAPIAGEAMSRTPTQRGELLVPQFMQGAGITPGTGLPDLNDFLEFGKAARELFKVNEKFLKNAIEPLSQTISGLTDPFLTSAGAAKTLAVTIGTTLITGFGAAAQSLVLGTKNIGQAFNSLVNSIIGGLAQKGGEFLGAAVFKGLAGLLFQSGGTIEPIRAQAGLVMSGTRGRDTVPALLGRGETVVSHTMTDRWDRTLSQLGSMIARMPTQAYAAAPGGNVTVPVSLTVNSHFVDRAALREFVEDHLTDLVIEAVSKGSFRRGG